MKYAPGVFVLGGIAYCGDHGRVFRRAITVEYATDQRRARNGGSGQAGRRCQTEEAAQTGKASTPTAAQITTTATGCPARAPRADRRAPSGTTATTFGKTEAQAQAQAQSEAEAQTKGETGAQACAKTSGQDGKSGSEAETQTETQAGR